MLSFLLLAVTGEIRLVTRISKWSLDRFATVSTDQQFSDEVVCEYVADVMRCLFLTDSAPDHVGSGHARIVLGPAQM